MKAIRILNNFRRLHQTLGYYKSNLIKMKLNKTTLLLILAMLLVIASCEDGREDSLYNSDLLVGQWSVIERAEGDISEFQADIVRVGNGITMDYDRMTEPLYSIEGRQLDFEWIENRFQYESINGMYRDDQKIYMSYAFVDELKMYLVRLELTR